MKHIDRVAKTSYDFCEARVDAYFLSRIAPKKSLIDYLYNQIKENEAKSSHPIFFNIKFKK